MRPKKRSNSLLPLGNDEGRRRLHKKDSSQTERPSGVLSEETRRRVCTAAQKGRMKREGHVLPKELKTRQRTDAPKVSANYAFDLVKQEIKQRRYKYTRMQK